jgi:hypothetical protein
MRYACVVSRFVFAAAFVCAAPAFADDGYFTAIEDLPLPPGFVEHETTPAFDGAGGRIVAAGAAGEMSALDVRDFYDDALPQLGWSISPRPDGVLMVQRGRERLTFTVRREGGRTLLGAQLVVLPASMNAD